MLYSHSVYFLFAKASLFNTQFKILGTVNYPVLNMPSTTEVLINVLLKQFLGGVRRYFKQYGFQLE